ncbi:rasp f 9, partial [Lineolata rhizophorae]
MRSFISAAAGIAALSFPFVHAQTFTDCDPTQEDCDNNPGLTESPLVCDFAADGESAFQGWTATAGALTYGSDGAEFTINQRGDAPTIQTDGYIFFGRVDVTMKAAPGTGIISSIVLQSDDLDEIDWEFIGGDNANVQSNFFGKGNTTVYNRGGVHPVADAQGTSHTYSVDWSQESMKFLIDDALIREVPFDADIALGGANYPQTPCNVRIGIWAGGDPDNSQGTIDWAGGETDYAQAPFTMTVQKVEITNYNPAGAYEWTDRSGSWESIE